MHAATASRLRGLLGAALLAALISPFPAAGQSAGSPTTEPDVPVTPSDVQKAFAQNSPAVVVDPTDPGFAAIPYRIDAPSYSCGLAVSGDGGRGWVGAQPVKDLPLGAERCYAPEVAFDRSGRLYYLFVGLAGNGNLPIGVFLATSTDKGRSFSTPRRILGPNAFSVRMAIDPGSGSRGRLHLVWLQAPVAPPLGSLGTTTNPIMAAHSDDGGATFTVPVQVSDRQRQRVNAPALALGPDRAVHVVYYDLLDDVRDYQGLEGPIWDGPWSLVMASSADGGGTFGPGVVVEPEVTPSERVQLIFTMPPATVAAGPGGAVYVGWHDARNGDWDVWLRLSADGGRTWSTRRRVNDDPVGTGRHQYLPRMAVAAGGRLDVLFYDRRNDPANIRNDVFFTWSVDGGVTFAASRKLNTESFDHRVGPRYPILPSAKDLVELGGRLGLYSTDDRVVAAWTDTRNAPTSPDDPVDLPPQVTNQEIFAATVAFSAAGAQPVRASDAGSSGGFPVGASVAAGAIGALVGGVLYLGRRRRATT